MLPLLPPSLPLYNTHSPSPFQTCTAPLNLSKHYRVELNANFCIGWSGHQAHFTLPAPNYNVYNVLCENSQQASGRVDKVSIVRLA